jgi:hypothetical protein
MKRVVFSAACLIAATPALAFEREVNDVWWAVYDNYDGGGQTACIAENYNEHPVEAVFEVFPVATYRNGAPASAHVGVTLAPFQTQKIWSGANIPGPGPSCELRDSLTHVP